ncbi:MAG TPA: hypothetical protein VGP93_01715, partial [Polyangiaceae bacterium]|nr:hypothetical protein [Polyangiaceae bacterium]
MSRDPSANPLLTVVTPGIARVSSLFTQPIRMRAVPYVGNGSIRVVVSDSERLAARVQGTETYVCAFQKRGDKLHYGCSCPFFADRNQGCKHLWALALQARESPVIQNAAGFKQFLPDAKLPFSYDDAGLRLEGGDSTADQLDDDLPDDDLPQDERQSDDGYRSDDDDESDDGVFRRASAGGRREPVILRWQDLVESVHSSEAAPTGYQYELFYFVRFARNALPGFSLAIGRRRVGTNRLPSLEPSESDDRRALVHDADRPLHALIFERIDTDYALHRSFARHRVTIPAGYAPLALRKLAETGRCHLVPKELGTLEASWRRFKRGARITRAEAETVPSFDSFSSWPLLSVASNDEPWQLQLAFERKSPRARDLQLTPSVVRGSEKVPLSGVQYAHPEGVAVIENQLTRCAKQDVAWIQSLTAAPSLRVPESEFEDFVLRSQQGTGVSRLLMPDDYAELVSEPPRPVLDLGDPSGRSVLARVFYEYGEQRVPAEQPGVLLPIGQKRVLRRDLASEKAALEQLSQAGFERGVLDGQASRPPWPEVLVPEKRLLPAIQRLLDHGWHVFARGKQYRKLSRVSLKLESGIDWFELKGGV